MYDFSNMYSYPYYVRCPICQCRNQASYYPIQHHYHSTEESAYRVPRLQDYGKEPFVINIENAAEQNRTFRTALWTGEHLQVTLMSIQPGEDIGLELHSNVDQFLRIEEGRGLVQMGKTRENLNFQKYVSEDDAIMVPAGFWHNLTNTGHKPIKLYSIYAPPEHPFGTVHRTKVEAMATENQS